MKNVLAFNRDDGRYDGEFFAANELEGESKTKYVALQLEREKFARLALPNKWVQLLIAVVFFLGVLLSLIAIEFVTGETVTPQDKKIAVILACAGVPLAACGAVGLVWIAFRAKKIFGSSDYRFFEEREKKLLAQFREELGVPETAVEVDAFAYRYRVKNGKLKYEAPASRRCYLNETVRVFADSSAFCCCAENHVFRIPFTQSPRLVAVEKRISFYGWNKQEKPNKGVYKQYKIRSNNDSGALTVKPCYSLQFYANGEDYEFLFPPYEYETLRRLIGATS